MVLTLQFFDHWWLNSWLSHVWLFTLLLTDFFTIYELYNVLLLFLSYQNARYQKQKTQNNFISVSNISTSTWINTLILIFMQPWFCHHVPVTCIFFEFYFDWSTSSTHDSIQFYQIVFFKTHLVLLLDTISILTFHPLQCWNLQNAQPKQ